MELYEKFFQKALKKDAERLGIVYTPVEVVDFILHSANEVLQDEFGRCLSDEGVHILDPFTGAGIFLARLLQSQLIHSDDLERKYREELHANEIVLLAYYIAAVNIEEAFHGRRGEDEAYKPFNGIVLTDTFNLNKGRNLFPKEWLPDNNERVERQQQLPIGVIVGNPPWSAGQRKAKQTTIQMWSIQNLKNASGKPILCIQQRTIKGVFMIPIQDGNPMGIRQDLMNKVSSPLLPTVHGLMGTLTQEFVLV